MVKDFCVQISSDITFLTPLLEEHLISPLPNECKISKFVFPYQQIQDIINTAVLIFTALRT